MSKDIDFIYRHKKSGGLYVILERGLLESTKEPVIIYREVQKDGSYGEIWVRPMKDFFDGRFEHFSISKKDELLSDMKSK